MSFAFLGAASVKLAVFIALYGLIASIWGAQARREDLVLSGRRATYALWGLLLVAVACLERYLILKDYSLEYVAEEVDNSMPLGYRITALWGGMNGSLLWWSLICATYTAACQWINRDRFRELMPWVAATCCFVILFLTLTISELVPGLRDLNPFSALAASDPGKGLIDLVASTHDGKGLNPLLQTYWMEIHPPTLYTGYIGFTIPFGFCIAALVTGRLDGEFLRATRRWTLFAWIVLGFGILLGAKWAYEVLGWGGYWGWDPVENASFMPWLCATAYVHSVIIQEKRGMLKGWNVFLILLTFTMTYFGTFLTRSGVVQSVHAFGSGPVGWWLGGFLFVLVATCAGLVWWRRDLLASENEIESVASREATFLYNNVGLLGFMLMVFVGTLFPVFAEAVKGNKIVVGPPFYNPLAGLITLGLLLLMGIGQLVGWRKTSPEAMMRNFAKPLWVTGGAWLLFLALLPGGAVWALVDHQGFHPDPWATALLTAAVFVVAGIVSEYVTGTRAVASSAREELTASFKEGRGAPVELLCALFVVFGVVGWAGAGVALEASSSAWRLMVGAGTGIAAVLAAQALASLEGPALVLGAVTRLFLKNRRRYGGYLVHLGLTMAVAGIVCSSLFVKDQTLTFKEGETKRVGEFDVTYTGLSLERSEVPGAWRVIAFLKYSRDGKEKMGMAYPEKRMYDKGEQPVTIVSIHENVFRDFYTILESFTDPRLGTPGAPKEATIRFLVRPLVEWLWFGGVTMVIGTAVSAWPERKKKALAVGARESAPRTAPAAQPAAARSAT